jgi:tryptophanyl-tRNA synthetase
MELVSASDTLAHFKEQYAQCAIRYGDLKKQLAEDIDRFIAPIRERFNDIFRDDELLRKVAAIGREKARTSASATLKEVRKAIGLAS